MKEELLHYIWKHRKLGTSALRTTTGERLMILETGVHNQLSGPDFFNARIELNGQQWAGNVEIHRKASDWYVHGHEADPQYSSIILHVVWEDDIVIFRKDNTPIPTLELRHLIEKQLLQNYHSLFGQRQSRFINCERELGRMNPMVISHWMERLFFERLEEKSAMILKLLREVTYDWERVLFILLLKSFGSKINGNAFLTLGTAVDFKIFRKLTDSRLHLEALLFGMCGMLEEEELLDGYHHDLRREYAYLKRRFGIGNLPAIRPEFFRLRPVNFPTLRLSQICGIYHRHPQLFSKVIEACSFQEYLTLFNVTASPYWNEHFSFGKVSAGRVKRLSSRFIDLILINTVLPLKFCYERAQGIKDTKEIGQLYTTLVQEKNTITDRFRELGVPCGDAHDSQAIVQLYSKYCTQNRCVHCAIGVQILNGKQ